MAHHRQFGIAFAAYATDSDQFPIADDDNPRLNTWSWGGVDWYASDGQVDGWPILDERPLNRYLGIYKQHEADYDVFRCPRDNSMRYSASDGRIVWEEMFGFESQAEDVNESIYAIAGTSYAANEWMWVHPQSPIGFGGSSFPHYKRDMGPDDILINNSQFILVTDWGAHYAGRYSKERQISSDKAAGWWHGDQIGHMTFLDGSARRHEMGSTQTQDYSYWSNPDVQAAEGPRP
ncbi:MAG: hypothetical protein ACF8NJ_01460 [Phycisphaerales bacterium JB038]